MILKYSNMPFRRTSRPYLRLPLPTRDDRVVRCPQGRRREVGRDHGGRLLTLSMCDSNTVGLGVGSSRSKTDHPTWNHEYNDHECSLGLLNFCTDGYHDAGSGWSGKWECGNYQNDGCRDGALEGVAAKGF